MYTNSWAKYAAGDFVPWVGEHLLIESLSKRRFCQHGRQPEVNRFVIDGEWWRQPFPFEITNVKADCLPLLISNENGWRHYLPSITARFTSGRRPCLQKRRLLKLSDNCSTPLLYLYWEINNAKLTYVYIYADLLTIFQKYSYNKDCQNIYLVNHLHHRYPQGNCSFLKVSW